MVHIEHLHISPHHQTHLVSTLLAMPHIIQHSGKSQRMRVQYTALKKLSLLASANCIWDKGNMLQQATKDLQVYHSLIMWWTTKQACAINPLELKSKKKVEKSGPLSQLTDTCEHVHDHSESIIAIAGFLCKELHSMLQHCEEFCCSPFNGLSNVHAPVTLPAPGCQGQGN
jgi:hypothetical protein